MQHPDLYAVPKLLFSQKNPIVLFGVFLSFLALDRLLTLVHFGFVYSDIDQLVLWNGAMDYSNCVFYEPYFYGQAYNYMLEAFLAAPLVALHMPVYIALPLITTLLSLLPFVVLAIFFYKRKYFFWAYLALGMPLLLPIGYNFLSNLPRGFVQAYLFIPLLYIPLFKPQSNKSVTILFLAAGLCGIANPSSVMVVLPIMVYVFTFQYKLPQFYTKSMLMLPFFAVDYLSKSVYKMHPEKVMHKVLGLTLDGETFLKSFTNPQLFEHLFPFGSGLGIVYPIVFVAIAIAAWFYSKKRVFLFIVTILGLLLVSFAVPKIQEDYTGANVFFSSSRVYLTLPLLFVISLFLVFRNRTIQPIYSYALVLLCGVTLIAKNVNLTSKINTVVTQTTFPVAKNEILLGRAIHLKQQADKYNIDLIVHANSAGWNYVFDAYGYNPLLQSTTSNRSKTISVNQTGDRRTWLYQAAQQSKNVLLNGYTLDTAALRGLDYKILNESQTVILNNHMAVEGLFAKLNLDFGGTVR